MRKSTFALVLFASASAFGSDPASTENAARPPDDKWQFTLAMPGWLPGLEGDTGVNGLVSHVDMSPGDVFRHYDFALSLRGEVSKGRFGIMGDLLYTSLSDGIGTETIVKKLDIQVDQTMADLAVRWRIIESPRGFLDVYAGVRYTNLFQQVVTQPNDQQIEAATEALGDEFSERVQQRVDEVISDQKLRNALTAAVRERITSAAANITGPNPPDQELPNGPLRGPTFGRVGRVIEDFVRRRAQDVAQAALGEARAAAQADAAAVRATTAAAKAAAQKRAAELRARVSQRIAKAKKDVQNEIENRLHDTLDARVARTDAWWDPFIGLRARYNLSDRWYLTARGDVGGFGVGSDFTWQAEGAIGLQVTRNVFIETGYRAFGVDYDKDGLLYDVVMHGAQITMGIEF